MDSTLAYIDQASFLGLRALGRGPLAQMIWIYDRPVDMAGLRRFQSNLCGGLLGRRIERAVLPFGRHHWVAFTEPCDIEVADHPRPRDQVQQWAEEQLFRPIDPEWGPPWRMAVQPLQDGGAAVTLIASHTVCDGLGMMLAVADAANGVTRDLGLPPPGARARRRALWQEARQVIREVPVMARAAVKGVRLAKGPSAKASPSRSGAARSGREQGSGTARIPTVTVYIDAAQWDARAESLGGTSNSLFAAIAARLGQLLGRVDDKGWVELSFPVSERTEGDTRGNALTGMSLSIDPAAVTSSLSGIRAEIKQKLAALSETPNELLGPLPLIPLVPRWLARRVEDIAVSDLDIGCSNLGEIDPAANRPDGTDAEFFAVRQMEPHISIDTVSRMGGTLFLASGRVRGRVFLTVSAWKPGAPNSTSWLVELVQRDLADFGLTGAIE